MPAGDTGVLVRRSGGQLGPPTGGGGGRPRSKISARVRSTPARLTALLMLLVATGLAAGAAGVAAANSRSDLVDSVRTRTGPLTVQAQHLYEALSDADTTATIALLSSGAEPGELRDRYLADINTAAEALAAVAADAKGDGAAAVRELARQLPVYTGLVETARTYHRQALPLGAAYLREASHLMRTTLLPAAQRLYHDEENRLGADRDAASRFPWTAATLGLLVLAGLVGAQRYLTRRTRRLFSLPLVAATAAAVGSLLWLGSTWHEVDSRLTASHHEGSAVVDLLAESRIAAREARADEALLLLDRGNGTAAEVDFTAMMDRLIGSDGTSGLLATAQHRATDPQVRHRIDSAIWYLRIWRANHDRLRELNDKGQYAEAVALVVGDGQQSVSKAFEEVDGDLAAALEVATAAFDRQAAGAARAVSGTAQGIALLAALALAGVWLGLRWRIAEYR